ncbi:bifunctional DNA primase/polymerase [Microbacterium sp. NPDC058062]|uniref:bifunctional DNA primase/polymerase n=1 Tax=Microbacterium sp. NPDC058062 TaxID=3346320 RepID=UPI0036DEE490
MSIADVLLTVARLSTSEAARTFVAAGLPVFPCEPGGKRPLTRAGYLDASRDSSMVSTWWRRWQQANIGLPTGPMSGVDVVDIDVKPDGTGFTAFHRAVDEGLLDGEIARVRTPSGGMHIYFPTDRTRPQRCWQAARAHIDFRGEGGYVVVPPSVVVEPSGVAAYRPFSLSAAETRPIDAMALRDFIDPRPAPARNAPGRVASGDLLAHWIAKLREGERNHGLFWAACRLSEAGVQADAIVDVLGPAASRIGLDDREIQRTVLSACRHTSGGSGGLGISAFSAPTQSKSHRDPRSLP